MISTLRVAALILTTFDIFLALHSEPQTRKDYLSFMGEKGDLMQCKGEKWERTDLQKILKD